MRRLIFMALMPFALIMLFSACTGGAENTAFEENMESVYQKITPVEAKELIGSEKVVLVDVRTRDEYEAEYIPGAVLLPLDYIQERAQSLLPDQYDTIIVYCRSGRRSAIAAKELLDMGYKTVYDLGGIIDWPYETAAG